MSELPYIVDSGSEISFPNYGKALVGELINNGTNSKVHKALIGSKYYAVKIHRAKKKANGKARTDFTSEFAIRNNSKRLCTPLDNQIVELDSDRTSAVFLMSDLSDYQMLRELLKRSDISNHKRLKLLSNLLLALNDLHSAEWLHGDLSDRNVMVNPETNDVQLIDFEWSVQKSNASNHNFEVFGTPEMISPEVRRFGNRALSRESEVWSVCKLGMMILDDNATKQFKEIDEFGVLNKLKEIGNKTPLYRMKANNNLNTKLTQILEKGTVADQELRPSLEEIIVVIEEMKSEEIPSFRIKVGNQHEFIKPGDDSTGFSVMINGKSYSLRRGKTKSIQLEDGVSLRLAFENQPNLSYHIEGRSGSIPLIEGTEFGQESKFTIQKLEYI